MRTHARLPSLAVAIAALVMPPSIGTTAPVPGGLIYTVILPAGEFGSLAFTAVVVDGLIAAQKFCAEIGNPAYRVDCLAERYGALAREIPRDSDYEEVGAALKSASERLATLARNNRDRTLARAHAARPGTSETTSRPLTPVAAAATAQVNRQALAILEETRTVLLRSAEGSQSKVVQFAKIADAIGSNKVLLRSA